MAPAKAFMTEDLLEGANINRSPAAYMANPEAERQQYLNVGNDTDHKMVRFHLQIPIQISE